MFKTTCPERSNHADHSIYKNFVPARKTNE